MPEEKGIQGISEYFKKRSQDTQQLFETLDSRNFDLIIEALRMTNWVQKDAADLLGVSRRVINYKVKIHNITHDRWRRRAS